VNLGTLLGIAREALTYDVADVVTSTNGKRVLMTNSELLDLPAVVALPALTIKDSLDLLCGMISQSIEFPSPAFTALASIPIEILLLGIAP
jgi:hypothetical protein